MNLPNKTAASLLGKDRNRAINAARSILTTPDLDAWKCLIDHDGFIFDFLKQKAANLLVQEYKKDYFENLLELMNHYSPSWEECFSTIINKFKTDETEHQILELLYEGSDAQQCYCARYFANNPNSNACEPLFDTAKTAEYELKINCAEALGVQKYQPAYDYYIEKLNSDDDWEILDAAEFLASYGDDSAIVAMFEAMEKSSMSEQIAGEIANLAPIFEYFEHENANIALKSLECFNHIISGLGEVWPLSTVFNFNIFDATQKLTDLAYSEPNELSSKYAQVLLKLKSQIELFMENKEYSYDEDKSVLAEIEEIFAILQGQDDTFWKNQKELLLLELKESKQRQLTAIATINEINLNSAVPTIIEQIELTDNEAVLSELILCLNNLGEIEKLTNKSLITNKLKDENLLAVVENLL